MLELPEKRGASGETEIEFEQVDDADSIMGEDQEGRESEGEEVHSEYYDSDEIGEYNSDVDDEVDSQLTRMDGRIYFDDSSKIPQFALGMLEDGEGYTIISDMQKGLVSAMHEELPQVHHRLCARHVFAAWTKKWRLLKIS
ncbi:hypothetical protein POM88_050509 [Heracleum sosnowskyi]|uniref:Transposase n=1 Tax=Heracleum sosnowskyi TaxID=360622 RepID=A0AAD8H074_9APIA|nr:hypothetical protein POM88_050509 [Heracleum sosnowskyi]